MACCEINFEIVIILTLHIVERGREYVCVVLKPTSPRRDNKLAYQYRTWPAPCGVTGQRVQATEDSGDDKARERGIARARERKRGREIGGRRSSGPQKAEAAAQAYQVHQERSELISINSNDKCGRHWQRLINSHRGKKSRALDTKSSTARGLNKC